jgi:hypothetical protein
LLSSRSAGERAVGREALMLAVAHQPDLNAVVKDKLKALHQDVRPHVRQSAAKAEEMITIVQRTQECLDDSTDSERWYEILEWLPDVGVYAARDWAQHEIREIYPSD